MNHGECFECVAASCSAWLLVVVGVLKSWTAVALTGDDPKTVSLKVDQEQSSMKTQGATPAEWGPRAAASWWLPSTTSSRPR